MAKKRRDIPASLFTGSLFGDEELEVHPIIARAAEQEMSRRRDIDIAATEGDDDMFAPVAPTGPGRLRFLSMGSGSSGNCSYVGTDSGGILIDAGVDLDTVTKSLRDNGLSLEAVKGIFVTHDHGDHVRYVYTIVRKYRHIGVYCTPRCFSGIMRRHSVSRRLKDYHRPIYKEFPVKIGDMEVTAFDVSHDGTDNSGYHIAAGGRTLTVATDLGVITPRVEHYMSLADGIVIESNYDSRMLDTGPYPEHLKARIRAANGHLDNEVTAALVSRIAAANPSLSHVFLCHLSEENNTPELALATMRRALAEAGLGEPGDASGTPQALACRLQVAALPRREATPLYFL